MERCEVCGHVTEGRLMIEGRPLEGRLLCGLCQMAADDNRRALDCLKAMNWAFQEIFKAGKRG